MYDVSSSVCLSVCPFASLSLFLMINRSIGILFRSRSIVNLSDVGMWERSNYSDKTIFHLRKAENALINVLKVSMQFFRDSLWIIIIKSVPFEKRYNTYVHIYLPSFDLPFDILSLIRIISLLSLDKLAQSLLRFSLSLYEYSSRQKVRTERAFGNTQPRLNGHLIMALVVSYHFLRQLDTWTTLTITNWAHRVFSHFG